MKTIGLVGGITWLSTMDYYRLLNQMVNERLGGVHSCKLLISSLEFNEIKQLTFDDDWDGLAAIVSDAAKKLALAGADCIMIGANTMHKIADKVQASINVPIIHIAAATGTAVQQQGLNKVALLGTKYTMLLDFYKDKLAEKNISTVIPGDEEIEYINDAIYNEMGKGIFLPERKARVIQIINQLQQRGAAGVVLGCTELPILIKQEDVSIPIFDTTYIHAKAAVDFALA